MDSTIGKLRLYGCGGAGINIASKFADAREYPASAKILASFLDTSRSNIKAVVSEDQVYILEDLDGSGKIRAENHQKISVAVKDMLVKHRPEAFNIVVFSASGGSGSVIGPLILKELISRGETAVAIVVGSSESQLTTKNTLNTLKTLEVISKQAERPVVVHYQHNHANVKRSEIDQNLTFTVAALAILSSRQNDGLDTQDLYNWVNFTRTTDLPPSVALLDVCLENSEVEKVKSPVSIASLFADPDEERLTVVPEYHCDGYATLPSEFGAKNMHFVISLDDVTRVAQGVSTTLQNLDEIHKSRVAQQSIVSKTDNVTDDGLVL